MPKDTPVRPRGGPPARGTEPSGNVLTRQMGPLAVWQWVAIGGATLLLYRNIYAKKSSTAAGGTNQSGYTYASGGVAGPPVIVVPNTPSATAAASGGTTSTTTAPNIATDNEAWLKSLYEGLLGREPDSSGLQFWEGRLQGGESRNQVLQDVLNSSEYTKGHATTAVQRAA